MVEILTTGIKYMNKLGVSFIVALGSTIIISCDGSSNGDSTLATAPILDDGGCPKIEGTGSGGALAGLYDITNYSASTVNVVYAVVSSSGALTEYDYDADSVGTGLNCFYKRQERFSSITHIADDRYWWTFANPFPENNNCSYVADQVNIALSTGGASFSSLDNEPFSSWRKFSSLATEDLLLCAQ